MAEMSPQAQETYRTLDFSMAMVFDHQQNLFPYCANGQADTQRRTSHWIHDSYSASVPSCPKGLVCDSEESCCSVSSDKAVADD